MALANLSSALNAGIKVNITSSFGPKYITTCKAIDEKVSDVYYFGHALYFKGNSHWASSSDQNSACVVEPASANDVSTILKIVGKTSTPFGVRSGGHATNPKFSSTPGVQIALFKFNQVVYHSAPLAEDGSVGTVEVGAGLIWDDVYTALEPHQVTVVGGRATGIGVGGFILGGGYSYLTNQYGLAIDNLVECELVLPNGTITTASETKNPDLLFGLKGGLNNFGIVTKFTMLAYSQTQVWGGVRVFDGAQLRAVNQATVDFIANVVDPKAAILPSTYTTPINGIQTTGISLLLFYDGPMPPAGIFERFTSIPHASSDLSTRSMTSLVKANPANSTYGLRSTFNTVSLKTYTITLLEQIQNQSMFWGEKMVLHGGVLASFAVEPFLPSISPRSKGGAHPHTDFLIPLNLDWSWIGEVNDSFFVNGAKESARVILNQAIAEGQDVAGAKQIKYPNYASADEDLKYLYGSNLDRLRAIKRKYDPDNVMSLTGGYRF
ncbi:FAD-binding domain protein [Ceratobasidium sp. AG-Ba]|nr:FAD-binding domain protein [Ceratobasidium sp. AG-Ba]QRW12992.1 FAD-binding domain protein [Ceratobasidium sp. AG-Ba]